MTFIRRNKFWVVYDENDKVIIMCHDRNICERYIEKLKNDRIT